jgi:hypothetical protein
VPKFGMPAGEHGVAAPPELMQVRQLAPRAG